jgi:predicted O-methyltransferase YrrM
MSLAPGLRRLAHRHLRRRARARRDAIAIESLAPVAGGYVPLTRMAMRPAGIATVLNDVVVNRRRRVVECGAGGSTLYIAHLLRERGGSLTTIEDDADWAARIADELEDRGLADVATIVVAPLEPAPPGPPWYARAPLEPLRAAGGIELLVVDGPAAYDRGREQARYPALPFFEPALAADATIVLDDVLRRGEEAVLARWERESGLRFERRHVDGVAVAVRGRGFIP